MKITEEFLRSLAFNDLKVLGRMFGVKAPSGKTKKVIITEILEIERGERAPYFSSKGRPAKNGKLFTADIDIFLKSQQSLEQKFLSEINDILDDCKYKILRTISNYNK